uniref:glutamate receptor 2.7-like n=1 Tax=Erigeron canadensis TaxID=72917 RepID=UPI001CB89CED|nr:glutamate receptor 2.7-like [Erigeron canadensis]
MKHKYSSLHQLHHHVMLLLFIIINFISTVNGTKKIGIGVILDMESSFGKTNIICINMALHDFYQTHNYTTEIVPHFRDAKHDTVEAASAAIKLLKDVKVMAIIGPHESSQAEFVVNIGNKAKVPILSLATSPSLSPKDDPYFVRVSHSSSTLAQPIAALVKSFSWRDVVFVYQDDFGSELIQYLSVALQKVGANIVSWISLSRFASHDHISDELNKLKSMPTRVFVVHLLPNMASIFFKKAKEAGMMQNGYAWIVTNLLHTLDPSDMDSMQGVVGVKPYIPRSIELNNFEKRFQRNNQDMKGIKVDVSGLLAYDTTCALAMALERLGSASTFQPQTKQSLVTDIDAIGTSKLGSTLIYEIRKTRLKGLSGDFILSDGQLGPPDYQIVNLIGEEEKSVGLWRRINGIISPSQGGGIIWPGGSNDIPRGWEIPAMKEKKLRVGVPAKSGYDEFIKIGKIDPKTDETKPTGFCVEVFEAVLEELPLAPSYEYIPFGNINGVTSTSYNDLVYQIFLKEFDLVIGDVSIRANRSKFVDFTLPYTESGIIMIVPIKDDDRKNAWIFLKPLETKLWLTACAFFIYTGVVVWVIEHQINKEFRGLPYKQVGIMFWYSFSTLVFAHKEKIISNLSRFVVVVWIFVVLVIQSSYIASLISQLTVQRLQPDYRDIYDLMRRGDSLGYKDGSYVEQVLKDIGFEAGKLKGYRSLQEYDDALSKGSKLGGVSAVFDELPYMQLFLATYCNKYIMVGPTYETGGFGFAFPKGSPLVPLVSKAISQVLENNILTNISNKWLGQEANCRDKIGVVETSDQLSLESFIGLFLIAGVSSTSALIIYFCRFLFENRGILLSEAPISHKFFVIAKTFDQKLLPDNVDETSPVHDIVETRIQM